MEALLDGEAEQLTRKAIEMAKAGDAAAMRLCFDRMLPPRKDRVIRFSLPAIIGPQDHPPAIAALIAAVAAGHLAPAEAQAVTAMLAQHGQAIHDATVDQRLAALEGKGRV